MKDLTNQKIALRSLFKHLERKGFSIISFEPQNLEDEDEILYLKDILNPQLYDGQVYRRIKALDKIYEFYFEYDDDYILTVEKHGKYARILQTWWGGVEGLYSNASCDKEIFDDLEEATEKWWDVMEAKEIQF